jgi:tetratricopeptide (TPR) repeat protein
MSLTHNQKRYIKKNLRRLSIDELAKNLNLSKENILSYLKNRWGEEKFKKFIVGIERQQLIEKKKEGKVAKWFQNNWLSFLFLTMLVFLAYANSLNNAFVSDDIGGIAQNPNIGNFRSIVYQPFAFFQPLLYFLAFKLGGLNPIFYRIINIFFHLGTVFVVYQLISFTNNQILAFLTTSLFAVHPILTESVTWISGGNYVRYSFFFLLSFLFYLLAQKNRKRYILSLIFFTLSFFCSEKAVILPLAFFIYELSFGELKNNWKKLLPFFLLSGIWIIFYFSKIGQRVVGVQLESGMEPGLYNPLLQVSVALTSYLQLIFWPDKLTLYHSEMSFSQLEYWIRVFGLIGLIGLIGYAFKKNKTIFFWLSFFIITLIPTLTPLKIAWVVAERYVYLGTIGVLFVIGYWLFGLIQNKKTKSVGYLIFIIIVISLVTRTIRRNFDWKNEDSLWIATGKTSPSSPNTHNNLGDVYGRRGDLEKSAYEFKKAIELRPNYADAYHNLGNTYRQMGKIEQALENYQKALKYKPQLWQSYQNIAAIYFEQKSYASAEAYMKKALTIYPTNADLYVNLGVIYLQMEDKSKAKNMFIKALEIDPQNKRAKAGLGKI